MKRMTNLLTGTYFAQGCWAIAEGAIAAGCRFFAGYPITPSTEIAERMAKRLPEVGGVFIQMEDELASMASLIGASYAGAKSMTATSGESATSCTWSWNAPTDASDFEFVILELNGEQISDNYTQNSYTNSSFTNEDDRNQTLVVTSGND